MISAVSRQSMTTAIENLRREYKNWLRVNIPTEETLKTLNTLNNPKKSRFFKLIFTLW